MVGRANTLSQQAYVPYTGDRVAGFDPMSLTAFDRMRNQQVAGQLGTATDLATQAGQTATTAQSYDPYTMGRFTDETVDQYMNPYIQNVIQQQAREAQRKADIDSQQRSASFVTSGAFGGSRQAVLDAEAARNNSQLQSDIWNTGLAQAYDTARQQFNIEDALREQSRQFGADLSLQGSNAALQSANILNQLGQTQFGQEMAITEGLGTAGALQQQQRQNELDVAYQDWVTAQQYPYEQLSWLQGILSGAPHSTTQSTRSHTSGVSTPGVQTTHQTHVEPGQRGPSGVSQGVGLITAGTGLYNAWQNDGAAQGGVIGLAGGGLADAQGSAAGDALAPAVDGGPAAGLRPPSPVDDELYNRMQNPNVPTLGQFAAQLQLMENQKLRTAARGGAPTQGQPTVVDVTLSGLASAAPDSVAPETEGGILGMADGGYLPFNQQIHDQYERKGSIYDPNFGLPPEERERLRLERERLRLERQAAREAEQAQRMQDYRAVTEGAATPYEAAQMRRAANQNADAQASQERQAAREMERAQRAQGLAQAQNQYRENMGIAQPADMGLGSAENRTAINAVEASMQPIAPQAGLAQAVPQPQARPMQAPAMPPVGDGRAPVTMAAPQGAPQAGLAAAQPVVGGLAGEVDQVQKQYRSDLDAYMGAQQSMADAVAADAARELAEHDAQRDKIDRRDDEARGRIDERGKDLDRQRKQAFNYALIRAGLAMMSGESPYALVNIGRGAASGLEGYQADLSKIDAQREELRAQLDKMAEARTKAMEAHGEQRKTLTREMRAAEREVMHGLKVTAAAAGLDLSKSQLQGMTKAMLDERLRSAGRAEEHGYRMAEIGAQGANQMRAIGARASGGSGSSRMPEATKLRYQAATRRVEALDKQIAEAEGSVVPAQRNRAQALIRQRDAEMRKAEALLDGFSIPGQDDSDDDFPGWGQLQ